MKFENNTIVLDNGEINIDLGLVGYPSYSVIEYTVSYSYESFGYYKIETFKSLNDAYDQYLKWNSEVELLG